MAIFGDPVTTTQYFGYSVALGGLVYYKLGSEKMQQLSTQTRLAAGDFRREHPGRARAIMICAALGMVTLVIWSWWPGESSLVVD